MSGVRGTIKKTNLGLSKPTSTGGVEKTYLILNATFCAIVVFAAFPHWPVFLAIPSFFVFHVIGRAINKSDPYFFEVAKWYRRYSTSTTKYLFAQKSVVSNGFNFVPLTVKVKGVKKPVLEDD